MQEPKRYIVCKTCAHALVYADTSAMDEDVCDPFEDFAGRNCPGCGELVYESGHVMEQVV